MTFPSNSDIISWLLNNPGRKYIIQDWSYVMRVGDEIHSYDLWYYHDEDDILVPEWDVSVMGKI